MSPTAEPVVLADAEAHLGHALALIHRVFSQLEEADRGDAVQSALRQAVAQVEAARVAHARAMGASRSADIDPEVLVLIAAAVAVVLDRPHRVLDVRKIGSSEAWSNAWAIEGRFQHYSSHKVR